ncbi:MAG: type I DNA topoisomerase, partial [Bacteroidales bacterium]|nr:type I DNA topoisomerase [Bacteroidales bacterium]
MQNLVIVESPAKAKTIEKFLGKDYKVTSSYGHIRDLKKHDFSIDIENNFQPVYEIPADKQQLVEDLKKAAKKADMVWLASDEDREGEAISWHLYEVLGLTPEKTHRIVFHEITKSAILNAIKTPRNIDRNLVNAQQARRVLDRIVGFELSPVLWRKVKPSLSAGRVQSVAVRLIVEREREIENFQKEESYRVTGLFATTDENGRPVLVNAELNKRFKTQKEAENFLNQCVKASFSVSDISQRPLRRQPAPPFTTSTLQQEAARKLHFSVTQTMSVAQRLYEAGQITYMRTDSVNLSSLCLNASKEQIISTMGENYLETRNYTTHSKGAQEAHEAIRPTYMNQTEIEGSPVEKRLYELIWKRTIASQMAEAQIEKTTIEINIEGNGIDSELKFIASGEVIKFDGFLRVYMESTDDDTETEEYGTRLPALQVNQTLNLNKAEATQRFTMHPLRYTEASLVKKMEELGIGRPSTYAPTISTIQQREYVEKSDRPAEKQNITHMEIDASGKLKTKVVEETYSNERGKLVPTDIGTVVNDYLAEHFPEIMSYNFTATVEEDFDKIADGKEDWVNCLSAFYKMFHPLVTDSLEERLDRKIGE